MQDTIHFCRRVGLDEAAISLEERLLNSVEEEGFEVLSRSQSLDWGESKKPVPLDIIYNVINHLYESENYSRAVEKGMHFIGILLIKPQTLQRRL